MGRAGPRPHDADVLTVVRRLAPLSLLLVIGLTTAGMSAHPVSADTLPGLDPSTLDVAAADLTSLLNQARVAHGLVVLPVDPQAAAMARGRAEAMAAEDALGHVGPDGRTTFDVIRASGMTWFAAGEVLAFNNVPGEPESTTRAMTDWIASPVHAAIVLSSDYNYVGFAAAVSASGNRYYAGVFMKLPDRTPGWAKAGLTTRSVVSATTTRVTVRWTGADTRLQVLTAGLRDFEVQRRIIGGAWLSAGITTHTSLSVTLARGRSYEFRVRSRDRAGNRSAWSSLTVRT